jgi:hypothetical protein
LAHENNVDCYCQPWNKLEGRGGSSEREEGGAAQVSGGRRDAPDGEAEVRERRRMRRNEREKWRRLRQKVRERETMFLYVKFN